MSTPAYTMASVQLFFTQNSMTPISYPPYSPDIALNDFFIISLDEKYPQRETFCPCGGGETKNSRGTKRHQNPRVHKLF